MKKILVFMLIVASALMVVVGYQSLRANNSTNQVKATSKPVAAKVQKADNAAQNDINPEEIAGTVMVEPDMAVYYGNINELVQAADTIVEGVVVNVSYFDYNVPDTDFTESQTRFLLKVTKAYTSNVKAGDLLPFDKLGGITTLAKEIRNSGRKPVKPIGKAEENAKVLVSFAGAPQIKVGDKLVCFGHRTTFYEPDALYVTVGAYMGRFTVSHDGARIERYMPKDDAVDIDKESLKMSKAEFDKQLADAVKNKK